jgi:hypothetical protein
LTNHAQKAAAEAQEGGHHPLPPLLTLLFPHTLPLSTPLLLPPLLCYRWCRHVNS